MMDSAMGKVAGYGEFKPAVFVNADSSSLKIVCMSYTFNTDELPLAEWVNIRMTTGYCSEGNLFFKTFINSNEVYSYSDRGCKF